MRGCSCEYYSAAATVTLQHPTRVGDVYLVYRPASGIALAPTIQPEEEQQQRTVRHTTVVGGCMSV
jgi:hypothetical protein